MGWDLALVKLAFKLKTLELMTGKIMFHCFLETEDIDPFFIEIDFKLGSSDLPAGHSNVPT
jgi:hypothetical protein